MLCRPMRVFVGVLGALFAGTIVSAVVPAGLPELKVLPPPSGSARFEVADLFHLRQAGEPQLSPDGRVALFTVQYADRVGAPYTRIWSIDIRSRKAAPWGGGDGVEGGGTRWSPDGRRVVYRGGDGLMLAAADGSGAQLLAKMDDSNTPMPRTGERVAWSPDGRRVAFVSAVATDERPMEADPILITRYWFRPARGWPQRFTDTRRYHLFMVDVGSKVVRQLTDGGNDEHSIDWAPDGRRLLFLTNYEADTDMRHNFDLALIDVDTKAVTRLTTTKGMEYGASWSPDGSLIAYSGLKRAVTSSETNMEDPHVWTIDPASGQQRELGAAIDNVQGRPQWSPDGRWLYFTVSSRGSARLHRLPARGGEAEQVGPAATVRGTVGAFSVARSGMVVAAMATPEGPPQLYIFGPGRAAPVQLIALNAELMRGKTIGETEAFTFRTYDDREIEAFLTKPAGLNPADGMKHPMIVAIHGGPHGQQGPGFNAKLQSYAARGWAVLMVNYRGSNGYGQSFANLIARDQNGGEGMDVLAGVDAALARYPWIDPDRLGVEGASYGGQLTNWLITQTTRFKAAIPWAGISNLVSHNYMSSYHDYLEQEYFGKPHTGGIADLLWSRSAIRFVDKVRTPVLLSHGDNDLLVNVAEDEQYFIALKDVGIEAIMLRYPREGHGMRESQHHADFWTRSINWYESHFAKEPATAVPPR